MQLSFAIPFKDRIDRLKVVIQSIVDVCQSAQFQDWEIVLSNNSSSRHSYQELKYFINVDLSEYSHCIRLHSLERTISLPENWLYALSLCKGRILNIRRSSDRLIQLDASILDTLSKSSAIDFVVTPSYLPTSSTRIDNEDYIRTANQSRQLLANRLSSEEKFDLLFSGGNRLGDLGGVYFKSRCMEQLSLPIQMNISSFIAWPDLEIYIRLILYYNGSYHSKHSSEVFYSKKTSSSSKAVRDKIFYDYAYGYPVLLNFFLPFNPQYRFLFDDLLPRKKVAYIVKSLFNIFKHFLRFLRN